MTARVYVLNSSDAPALKKMLEYDPYLDPNLIPKMPKGWDDPEFAKIHPELAAQIEQKNKQGDEALKHLREDKELNIIFARQDYQLKDGIVLGLDREKSYLYICADENFLNDAEAKLKKNIASIQRTPQEIETQIISTLDEEKKKSDEGLGFIFG
jgi:hypothetical protein